MTKPNPFAAVISDLRWIISNHETADFAPIVDIEAAMRLLEAAGKVDKQKARNWYFSSVEENDGGLHALLSALPDEVKP